MRKQFFYTAGLSLLTVLFVQSSQAQNSSPYWSLAGNSNATSSSKLGTTNSVDLRLVANNVERMRIVASNGRVGIGTTAPINILTVHGSGGTPSSKWVTGGAPLFVGFGESTSGNADYILSMASNTSYARPVFIPRRARGTLASPAVVQNNDYLASFLASGYDGSNFQNPAAVDFYVDGTPSSGHVPGRISFVTGTAASDRKERLIIKANGNIGIGTSSPSYPLHVEGGSNIAIYGNSSYLGVYGSGGSYGVYGYGNASGSYGVYGYGDSYGLYGNSYNSSGTGVYGTGYYGVHGSGTYGVYGTGTYGLYGSSTSTSGYGTISYGGAYGVYTSGTSYGLYAYSSTETGVYGYTGGGGTNEYGVYGYNASYGYGVRGYCQYGSGVYGSSGSGYAGYFAGSVYATTFTSSDRKLKKNIVDFTSAMDIINKLQPKSYEFRQDGNYKLMHLPEGKHYGLIAQDLEQVLPNLVKDSHFDPNIELAQGVKVDPKNQSATQQATQPKADIIDFKAVNYTELIPIMVKAMQEQSETIKNQQQQINDLKDQISRISGNGTNTITSMGLLGQASPNPTNGTARISYSLPAGSSHGQLMVTDAIGKTIKVVSLDNSGYLNLNVAGLSSGMYNYSLLVNGKVVETKKMEVVR